MNFMHVIKSGLSCMALLACGIVLAQVTEIDQVTALNDLIAQNKPVVLKFYLPWCPPCKMLAPVFEAVAEEEKLGGQCLFGAVEGSNNGLCSAVCQQLKIAEPNGFPTIVVVSGEGKVIAQLQGYRDESTLVKEIQTIIEKNKSSEASAPKAATTKKIAPEAAPA